MSVPVLYVEGALDGNSVHGFLQQATDRRGGGRALVVDLSRAVLRSAGIGALVHLHADLHAAGGTLSLAGLQPDAVAVLKMLGVFSLFAVVESPVGSREEGA